MGSWRQAAKTARQKFILPRQRPGSARCPPIYPLSKSDLDESLYKSLFFIYEQLWISQVKTTPQLTKVNSKHQLTSIINILAGYLIGDVRENCKKITKLCILSIY